LHLQSTSSFCPVSQVLVTPGHATHVSVLLAASTVEYVSMPQCVHTPVPLNVLYCPAGHALHAAPSVPL